MSFKDAAIVATVAAFSIWVLEFLASATIGTVRADPWAFVFDAIKTYMVSWAGTFLSLAGLEQYISRRKEREPSE